MSTTTASSGPWPPWPVHRHDRFSVMIGRRPVLERP